MGERPRAAIPWPRRIHRRALVGPMMTPALAACGCPARVRDREGSRLSSAEHRWAGSASSASVSDRMRRSAGKAGASASVASAVACRGSSRMPCCMSEKSSGSFANLTFRTGTASGCVCWQARCTRALPLLRRSCWMWPRLRRTADPGFALWRGNAATCSSGLRTPDSSFPGPSGTSIRTTSIR
jgi:hypothetical protein